MKKKESWDAAILILNFWASRTGNNKFFIVYKLPNLRYFAIAE